ncbi:nacht nucleoside triphosphatase [Ilyonectria robusta]
MQALYTPPIMVANMAQQTMDSINFSLGMSPIGRKTLLWLLVGGICTCLLFRPTARPKPASSPAARASDPTPSTQQGVYLTRVHPDRDEADTDIDIIAIHGLDTTSRDTWTWKDPRDPKTEDKWVNWLRPGMLPDSVDRVRIFTCDWPADLLQPSDLVQKTIEEYALLLLDGIQRGLLGDDAKRGDRPILFIASCLGGIILTKALVDANVKESRYYRVRRATRGIVFLATSFRGTSFQDVAVWAELGLKARASIQGGKVSKLLGSVKSSTFDLEELVRKFTQLCQDRDNPCQVFNFYELGTTSLPHKVFPWLPACFHQGKQVSIAKLNSFFVP